MVFRDEDILNDVEGNTSILNRNIISVQGNSIIIRNFKCEPLSRINLNIKPNCYDIYKDKLLVGYLDGLLEIYSIEKGTLITSVKQSSIKSIIQGTDEGHLADNPIMKVFMLNSHSLISLDTSNKLFYTSFKGIQRLKWLDGLDKHRLYGNYKQYPPSHQSIILDVLPFNHLVAILTPSKLLIITLLPKPSIIYKAINTSYTPSTYGNLSFNNDHLIFNWSNTLYKLSVSDNFSSTNSNLPLHVSSCHWLSHLILIRSPSNLILIHPSSFDVLESHPLKTPTQSQFHVSDRSCYYLVS